MIQKIVAFLILLLSIYIIKIILKWRKNKNLKNAGIKWEGIIKELSDRK